MTQITLTPELEKVIEKRAKAKGTTTEAVALEGLHAQFLAPAKPSLDEILAPVRREFEASGMTESELDALIEEAREEVWQEQQLRKAS